MVSRSVNPMRNRIIHESWQASALLALQQQQVAICAEWQQQQLQHFLAVGFPHRKLDHWKYTNLNPLLSQPFSVGCQPLQIDSALIHAHRIAGAISLVFLNGRYMPQLSTENQLPVGVVAGSLAACHKNGIARSVFTMATEYQTPFSLLNDALFQDGFFLDVAPNTKVQEPIHLIFYTDVNAKQTMHHPRHSIQLGDGAEMTVIEHYVGSDDVVYFNNIVTQINVGHHAQLHWYQWQQEGNLGYRIANTVIQQGISSHVKTFQILTGGQLSRDDFNINLQGQGSSVNLLGLYHSKAHQYIDAHTRVDHRVSQTKSEQNYKSLVDGQSHVVFNGKMIVHPEAIKTEAKQSNKNLLLSSQAEIDTKPELEIYADDVKCTHGATVGQLDSDALFYLQSRGIEKAIAERVLMTSFVNSIIEAIPLSSISQRISQQWEK